MSTLFYTGGVQQSYCAQDVPGRKAIWAFYLSWLDQRGFWGDLGVVWGNCRGVFGDQGVFLDDMWGVLDDCYSKLASSLLANLLIEINADIHRKIGGSKEN